MASASAAATPAGGCCAGAGVARAATTTGAPALLDAGALTTAVGAEALARVGSGEVLLCARAAGTALGLAGGDGEGIAAVLGGVGACASAALRDSSVADFLAALVGPTLQLRVVDGEVQLGGAPGVWVFDFGGGSSRDAEVLVTLFDGGAGSSGVTSLPSARSDAAGCALVHRDALAAVPSRDTRGARATGAVDERGVLTMSLLDDVNDSAARAASLTLNENCDPDVRVDMAAALARVAANALGASAAPTDERAGVCALGAMIGGSVCVPLADGRPLTGTWQGVWLARHAEGAQDARIAAQLLPARAQTTLSVSDGGRGAVDITEKVRDAVSAAAGGSESGAVHVFVRHTSAALVLGALRSARELEEAASAVVPRAWHYEFFRHTAEGEDDMVGHIKSTLLGVSVCVPVRGGELALPEGAGVLLVEHRDGGGWGGGSERQIVVTLL